MCSISRERALYEQWLAEPLLEPSLAQELRACGPEEIEDRFCRPLAFGTGGLRGVLGAGINRMNVHTVAQATRGLAAWLREQTPSPSAAIAYDSRLHSAEFACVAAAELAAAGVRVWLYPELTPTPMLSFAVRHLGCTGGIVITASHNPAKYNGYKVYGPDGCQIGPETAERVQAEILSQPLFSPIPDFDALVKSGAVRMIGGDVTDAYFSALMAAVTDPPSVPLKVVYTPLNGTGNRPVRRMLAELGSIEVTVVPRQELPDGNFPTCPFPNPEVPEALTLAAELTAKTHSDFFLATDPDCDRVGMGVLEGGKIRLFSGNETGLLLLDYICARRTALGTMPKRPVAVKTIVTTPLAERIAGKYGVELRNVLTGFKFIGEQISALEAAGETDRYIFGFEESCGYLSVPFVRDKDGVNASMLICQMAAWHKSQGRTLSQALDALYREFGYCRSDLLSFQFEGPGGMRAMESIMDGLRSQSPAEFAGRKVLSVIDYLAEGTGLPKSNVLALTLDGGCRIVIRPSGTEPKLKLYLSAEAGTEAECRRTAAALANACRAWKEALA